MSKEKTIKELATAILNLQSGYKTLQERIRYLEQQKPIPLYYGWTIIPDYNDRFSTGWQIPESPTVITCDND